MYKLYTLKMFGNTCILPAQKNHLVHWKNLCLTAIHFECLVTLLWRAYIAVRCPRNVFLRKIEEYSKFQCEQFSLLGRIQERSSLVRWYGKCVLFVLSWIVMYQIEHWSLRSYFWFRSTYDVINHCHLLIWYSRFNTNLNLIISVSLEYII